MSYKTRRDLYKGIEDIQETKVLLYVTGDQQKWETQIHPEILDSFVEHLDKINKVNKISLILYSRGGNTLAAWSLVNLIRQFCNEFEVIVPNKAHSAATLICLGANNLVMTKQATLGPIDPSVNNPLNPHIPGAPENMTFPVNVESINGFIELIKTEIGIKKGADLAIITKELMSHINPLVLGEVYRARSQIKMLARKLLHQQISDKNRINKIINFLCSDSGSHDYTINRIEAKNELGLSIQTPDDKFYQIIKSIYNDFATELELNRTFNPLEMLGPNQVFQYSKRRALLESLDYGSHYFETQGVLAKIQQPTGILINDNRIVEGWKYESI
jgi:hypothetical protein